MINDLTEKTREEAELKSTVTKIEETIQKYQSEITSLPAKKQNFEKLQFENKIQLSRFKNTAKCFENAIIKEAFASSTINIIKLDEPEIPSKPAYPNIYLNLIIGLIAGFLFGYTHIFIAKYLDNKIRNLNQLEHISNYHLLGTLSCLNDLSIDMANLTNKNDSKQAEYRRVRSTLNFLKHDIQDNNIAFVYINDSNISTVALANIAVSLARTDSKVLLVETNYRNSLLHNIFNLDLPKTGLSNYLTGDIIDIKSLIQQVKTVDNVYFLPAGTQPPDPANLLDTEKMKNLISVLSGEYDYVFYNLPPLNKYAEALIILRCIAGNVLIANANETSFEDFKNTQLLLERYNIKVLGTLLLTQDT